MSGAAGVQADGDEGDRARRTILHLVQATIEIRSALSVGAGRGEDGPAAGGQDAPVVLDAHGLPLIPGTSIAGVLRGLWTGADEALLFGHAGTEGGTAARLEVSAAVLHDSADQPAPLPALDPATGMARDPLLAWYQTLYRDRPIRRRRVRLTERGVADDQGFGLFNRTVVPRGSRFTFELAFWADPATAAADAAMWGALLALLDDPRFRLGAATRAGLGAVAVIRRGTWRFDLATPAGYAAYAEQATALRLFAAPLDRYQPAADATVITLACEPVDFWRVGGGQAPVASRTDPDHQDADLAPFTEPVVTWDAAGGHDGATWLLIPGTSIKGALRHRVAFHYDRLTGDLLDADAPMQAVARATDDNPAVIELFGTIKGRDGAQRGRVIIDDVLLAPEGGEADEAGAAPRFGTITHNAIDRFTGGVRNGFLFSEQMVWRGAFEIRLTCLPPAPGADPDIARRAAAALDLALDDLCHGRLALGAAGGRGHGRLKGQRR